MKKIISAGIVPFYVKNNTREYLVIQHSGNSASHWDFPKGKVEEGESKHQAAVRELQEEVGITASVIPGFEHSFSYHFTDYDGAMAYKTVYFYIANTETQKVVLSHEHQNYVWLGYNQAREKLTYENAKKLLDDIHAFLEK